MSSNSQKSGGCRGGIFRADLKAYLDDELSAPRRMLVDFHLSRCSECQEEMAWLKRLGRSMSTLEGAQPSSQLRARILSTLPPMEVAPAYQTPRRATNRPRFTAGAFAAVAACGLLFAAGPAANHYMHSSQAKLVQQPAGKVKPGTSHNLEQPTDRTLAAINGSEVRIPSDPTSAEADRLVAAQAREERQRMAKQVAALWSKAVAAVASVQVPASTSKVGQAAVLIGLSSENPDKAEASVTTWLKNAGAEFAPAGSELVVRISTEKANTLFQQLRKAGEVASITASVPPAQPGSSVQVPADHRPIPAVPTDDHSNNAVVSAVPKTGSNGNHPETVQKPVSKAITIVVMFGRM